MEVLQLPTIFDWDPWDPEKSQEFLNFVGLHKYDSYVEYKEKDKFDIIIQVKSHDFLPLSPLIDLY